MHMAFYDKKDLKELNNDSQLEADQWREDYSSYERLMNNDLMEGMDSNLPEVNDGSLSAALFKLPKRVVPNKLSGSVVALDRDEKWISEIANIQWRNEIIPNANTQAPFIRKWKDAVRKAAGYGSVPLITISVERDDKNYTDFIVAQPQDVRLEAGKVSDYDSDVIFWDVYYSKKQLKDMIEQAKEEQGEHKDSDDGYNKWDIKALNDILKSNDQESRTGRDTPRSQDDKVKPKGFKFCVVFQRGVDAPFYMYHSGKDKVVREWTNPDPTGDIPVHYLYCYQDFINPYGIGIVKLAGGTQNVLDYMRQADVLATQIGLKPPIAIGGNEDQVDIDSLVYEENALWFTGGVEVQRQEIANGVYNQLPGRIQMYKTSLNQIIPMGDTSATSAQTGDPTQSKTPAGVKLQAANLSIDDEDFKDNLFITYGAVAKSMINTHFANMEGTDLMKLSDDERSILMKAGMVFPANENGEMTNELEVAWDDVRAKFNFEVDAESDKMNDEATQLEGLTKVAELIASNPTIDAELAQVNKKINRGELYAEIMHLTSDNDKIVTDIGPEDQEQQQEAMAAMQQSQQEPQQQPKTPADTLNYKDAPEDIKRQIEAQAGLEPSQMVSPTQQTVDQKQQQLDQSMQQQDHSQAMDMVNAIQPPASEGMQGQLPEEMSMSQNEEMPEGPTMEEMQANVEALMQEYGIDENTALTALAAEHAGLNPQDIMDKLREIAGGVA